MGLIDLLLRASNEGLLRPRVARARKIIRLHPSLSSCAFCEQAGHLAAPFHPSPCWRTRPKPARVSDASRHIQNSFQPEAPWHDYRRGHPTSNGRGDVPRRGRIGRSTQPVRCVIISYGPVQPHPESILALPCTHTSRGFTMGRNYQNHSLADAGLVSNCTLLAISTDPTKPPCKTTDLHSWVLIKIRLDNRQIKA